MIILLRLVIFALGIGCLFWGIIFFFCWSDYTDFSRPKIKFESFKKFYEINPTRWTLQHSMVGCKTKLECSGGELFRFSFIDYIEYKLWKNDLARSRTQEQHNKVTKRMLDAVKQDIADSEAKAKSMQNKAIDDLTKWANDNNLDINDFME
jgi:hypothetical protein